MKKIAPVALVIAAAIMFASCSERNYDCTCTYTDFSGVQMKDISPVKGTQKEAQNACNAHGSTLSYSVHTSVSCHI